MQPFICFFVMFIFYRDIKVIFAINAKKDETEVTRDLTNQPVAFLIPVIRSPVSISLLSYCTTQIAECFMVTRYNRKFCFLNNIGTCIRKHFLQLFLVLKCPYDQIFDTHFFTFLYTIGLPWTYCQISVYHKVQNARFLDLYFRESMAALKFSLSNRPFYSCRFSDLASEWQRGWR